MDSEESFLETLARYSFPIPLLTGTKGRRSATSTKKEETQERLKNANLALKTENGRLENELRATKAKMGTDSNIELKYNSLLEVIKKLNPKLKVDQEIQDEINSYESKTEQIERLTAESENLEKKIKHIEANRIDPEQLLALVEPITDAMKGSFDTFTEFGIKLRLGDENSDKQAKVADKIKSDFLTHFNEVEESSPGSAKNEASLALLNDMVRFTNEIETIKKEIIANIPDFQDLDEEIRKVTEALNSSEQTLRIMVDLFGADKKNYATFETTCNDRVKVSASLTKIVSMPNFTSQFAALKTDLGKTENLLTQHEDLKRAMLANRKGVPDLEQLAADVDKNLGLSEDVIGKFEGDVTDKKFSNELKAARTQREKLQATNMAKAKTTADKSMIQIEKLTGLINLQNKFLQLKTQAVEIAKPAPAETVEILQDEIAGPSMSKKNRGGKVAAGRRPQHVEAEEETKGQDTTDWQSIHETLNSNLENAESALSACHFSSGQTDKKSQSALDKLMNSSKNIRKYGSTPKNPEESLQQKEKILAQILEKISSIANSAEKQSENKSQGLAEKLAQATAAREESENKASELVTKLAEATAEKQESESKAKGFMAQLAEASAAQEEGEKKRSELSAKLQAATKEKTAIEKKQSGFAAKLAKATAAQEASENKAQGLLAELSEATKAKEAVEKKQSGFAAKLAKATAAQEESENKAQGLLAELSEATKAKERIEKKQSGFAAKLAKATAKQEESESKTKGLLAELSQATKAKEEVEKKSSGFAAKLAQATAAKEETEKKSKDLVSQLASATKAKDEVEQKASTFAERLAQATAEKEQTEKKANDLVSQLSVAIKAKEQAEGKANTFMKQLAEATGSTKKKAPGLLGSLAKDISGQDDASKIKDLEDRLAAANKTSAEMQEQLQASAEKCEELEQQVGDAVEQQDQLMEEKENLSEECEKQASKIKEMEASADAMKIELDQVSSGATDFEAALDEKDTVIDDLQDQVDVLTFKQSEFTKYKHLYDGREGELKTLQEKIDALEYQMAEIKGQNKLLMHENSEKSFKCRQLETFQRKAIEADREAKKLKQRIKNFEELEAEKMGSQQQLVDTLNADLLKCCEEKEALEARIKEMEEEASTSKEDRNAALLMRCVNKMLGLRRQWQLETFLIWKLYEPPAIDIANLDTQPIDFDDVEVEKSDLDGAQNILNRKKQRTLESNSVMILYNTSGSKNEKPMPYVNVFRFFEDLMDKKYDLDNTALAANQKPQEITEFMLQHLNKMFGLKKLAIRQLSQIMPSLSNLVNEQNKYGSIYARILQIFHPSPLPFNLTLYLTRMRKEFNELIEKGLGIRGIKQNPRASRRTAATSGTGRAAYELAAVGGEAMLNDVLNLISATFDADKQSAELMMKLCSPEGISDVEFIIFKICHKMCFLGQDAKQVFEMIDADGSGTLDRDEFGSKAKELCELTISVEDITKVFDHIDTDRNGSITLEEFQDFISLDKYEADAKTDAYLVTKAQFMNALVDTFCALQRRDAAYAFAFWNDEMGNKNATKDQAIALAQKKDSDMPESIKNQLISDWEGLDTITSDDFVLGIINRNVGGLGAGVFYIPELANVIEQSNA